MLADPDAGDRRAQGRAGAQCPEPRHIGVLARAGLNVDQIPHSAQSLIGRTATRRTHSAEAAFAAPHRAGQRANGRNARAAWPLSDRRWSHKSTRRPALALSMRLDSRTTAAPVHTGLAPFSTTLERFRLYAGESEVQVPRTRPPYPEEFRREAVRETAIRRVRIHRGVLQPPTPPLHPRDALPSHLRTTTTLAARRLRTITETATINRQTRCHANRGTSTVHTAGCCFRLEGAAVRASPRQAWSSNARDQSAG